MIIDRHQPATGPIAVFATMLVVLFFLVPACSAGDSMPLADGGQRPVMTADQIVVVAGSHANVPRPVLSPQATALVRATMSEGGKVDLLLVSSRPVFAEMSLNEVGGTPDGREAAVKGNLQKIDKVLGQGPTADGADLMEATALAVAKLRAGQAKSPLIILADSGLTDSGRLQLTTPGMLGAEPAEVVDYLKSTDGLADMNGTTMLLSGIGYTAPPQEPLDEGLRARVRALWTAVFEAAGAKVVQDADPNTGSAISTTHTVTPVQVPAAPEPPRACAADEVTFNAQSAVSFVAEKDVYVDGEAARAALAPLAAWLRGDPRRTAAIRGTTANDLSDPARLRQLGQRRADAVAHDLGAMGVRTDQLSTQGVGADFPEYVLPDRDAVSGQLLPAAASLNRSVRIALDGHC